MNSITKEMSIAEILELVPDAVEVMLEEGLQCVGCSANTMESLEEGMIGHGFTDAEINLMVQKINELHTQKTAEVGIKPQNQDFLVQKIQEGNKTYYKVAGLMFSQKAHDAIHELAGELPALCIKIEAGGCAGYSLNYDYQVSPKSDEKVYSLSPKMELHLSDFTFEKLHGSIVDFESGLKGSGLKFHNPNTKGACGCGTSIAF